MHGSNRDGIEQHPNDGRHGDAGEEPGRTAGSGVESVETFPTVASRSDDSFSWVVTGRTTSEDWEELVDPAAMAALAESDEPQRGDEEKNDSDIPDVDFGPVTR